MDSTTALGLKRNMEKDPASWRSLVSPLDTRVQADSGRFELSQLPLQQQRPLAGKFTEPLKIAGDDNTSFMYIIKLYPERQPRNFEDAKGFVLNDYQMHLEEKWIAVLKKNYPVKIDESVLRSLLKPGQ
jgi:peptidyl-prolyl cis-trans isomerase SurA